VSWSRCDHTPAQVIAGVLLGGGVAATVFPLLR
jgi:hypothetical protein